MIAGVATAGAATSQVAGDLIALSRVPILITGTHLLGLCLDALFAERAMRGRAKKSKHSSRR